MEFEARALARMATEIESRDPQALAQLDTLKPGHARVVGITGPPGAGKSTLVGALATELRRQGKTVGILAVDPSSRSTGGAILGDRIRMQQHHGDPDIFIRSMATRGSVGGLARSTSDLVRLLDAAGKDYVIVETVGVGQDEIEIAALAQVTVVVLVPGAGDDVQAIKAGIMEIADVFAINKADLPGAERVEQELNGMLSLGEGPKPAIAKTVATDGTGIAGLLSAIDAAWEARGAAVPPVARIRPNAEAVSIDHLGIAVPNIEQALQFYGVIGLADTHCETVDSEKVHVAMLPTADSRIELLEPSAPDSPISKFLEKRGPGLHHVALRVPDLSAAVDRLRAAGARLLNEPRRGAGGHLYVFVHPSSTGGVLLELIQERKN